ncbi:hypothetical protein F2P81_008420 [Scophthalmus maximus]|uniref:Uncharacterized protein n=1 Tax=Scophthalmus maximus TaxID=52904 RepID=A0A6A4T4Z6_SCOMX|nr:hypothetical protein F2P81_008420 [Scophthalmus maximus]
MYRNESCQTRQILHTRLKLNSAAESSYRTCSSPARFSVSDVSKIVTAPMAQHRRCGGRGPGGRGLSRKVNVSWRRMRLRYFPADAVSSPGAVTQPTPTSRLMYVSETKVLKY